MDETMKPKKTIPVQKEITARGRLQYVTIRLAELATERNKLAIERKALQTKLRAERAAKKV